jgi:hypothetical protein
MKASFRNKEIQGHVGSDTRASDLTSMNIRLLLFYSIRKQLHRRYDPRYDGFKNRTVQSMKLFNKSDIIPKTNTVFQGKLHARFPMVYAHP